MSNETRDLSHHLKNFADMFQRLAVATLAIGGVHAIFSLEPDEFLSLDVLVATGGLQKVGLALVASMALMLVSTAALQKSLHLDRKLPMAFYGLMILIAVLGAAGLAYLDFHGSGGSSDHHGTPAE